jgi:ribosomal protein L40E
MTVTCPKGHESTEPDFCSECGARLGSAMAETSAPAAEICPDCNSARPPDGGKFCELCGYNFETGAYGEIPLPPAAPEKWTVLVTVDPALKEPGSPDPPPDWSPVTIAADRDTLLIGRTSKSRAIAPEIPLDFDTAVSHRHAVLTRTNASGWSIRDVGSSNGTRLNGRDIQAMIDVPLNPGDRVTLGHWTCITLSRAPQT